MTGLLLLLLASLVVPSASNAAIPAEVVAWTIEGGPHPPIGNTSRTDDLAGLTYKPTHSEELSLQPNIPKVVPSTTCENRFEAIKFAASFFVETTTQRPGIDESLALPEGLQIIGAGFGRTGTKSLEAALQKLGHKIYDVRSMIADGTVLQWVQAAREVRKFRNYTLLDKLLADMEANGYTATLDFPMCLFAPIFAQRRPDAKVIMTVRKSTDDWLQAWTSVVKVMSFLAVRPWSWLIDITESLKLIEELYGLEWSYPTADQVWRPVPWFEVALEVPILATEQQRQAWKDLHDGVRAELEAELPENRFLVYRVTNGWGPLLEFLGIEDRTLAKQPFPWVNDTSSLQAARNFMDFIAVLLPLWVLLLLWLIVAVGRFLARRLLRVVRPKEQAMRRLRQV